MRKNFYLSGLFLCILALCVCGCGGGSAADPMGTATVQFVDESGSVITSATVSPEGSITLIAKVTNLQSDGTATPVVNEKVSFSMVTAGNGGGVSVVNDRTASGGQAMAVYTAGNSMASDTVRVTTEGSGATATITITKSGTIVGARIATLSPSPSAVAAGQTSVITANVTDGSYPMWGETVTFTLPVNESGASFVNAAGVYVSSVSVNTDASGNAVAIYTAGSNSSLTAVYDTVQAELQNGSSNAVVITVSAGTPPSGAVLTLSADPTAVNSGQTSVITATVTGGTSAGANEAVTLTIPVNNSGGRFINGAGASVATVTITTGSGGTASAVYKAGTNASGAAIQDTVQGVLSNGALNSVTITVNAGVTGYVVTVTATPSTLTTRTGVSVITANVKNNTGTAYVGASVAFDVTSGTGAGIATVTSPASTDANGNAVANYSSTHTVATSDIVTATTTIGGVIYTGATTISVP